MKILYQINTSNSREERIAMQVALTRGLQLQGIKIQELASLKMELASGSTLPIGSVEFFREALKLTNIDEPANLSYPDELKSYLHRSVTQCEVKSIIKRCFVKSINTKTFTGFVYDPTTNEHLEYFERQQQSIFESLSPETRVWVSNPVNWISEYRYYVVDGEVLGYGRYDDGHDDAPMPHFGTVLEMITAFTTSPIAYSLDVGVLSSGRTALIECNDAWALGYYTGTLSPENYIEMLWRRWRQLWYSREAPKIS